MDDYQEFLMWMQQNYPEELEMAFGNKGGTGFDTGFGTTGGYQLPAAQKPNLGSTVNTAVSAATKIPGVMNPYLSTGLYAGGALLKALQGDPGASTRKAAKNRLTGMLGTDVLDVGKFSNMGRAAMMPRLGQMSNAYTKRFGLDSGKASQMMLGEYGNSELEMLARLMEQNARMKSSRDLSINSALLNYRG